MPVAFNDLRKIGDWYEWRFGKSSANKVVNGILDAIERLESFPNSGSLTPDEWLNVKGYRMVICDRHAAIYRLIEDVVYVYHIVDTRTQYTMIFEKYSQ